MALILNKKLRSLQKEPSNIRNLCILAHVDHGKTSLADSLVATNGIISSRMAGKLRYMDSRKDEQERGITMKSSVISLFYICDGTEFLVNLMDSPGHVDFSSEVCTAVRLCDGAVVVVDVVEGVQPQTKLVLKQAWEEGIKPILVLNKLDRLIVEMKLDTLAAYHHISQVLEQVNAVMGELFTASVMESQEAKVKEKKEEKIEFAVGETFDWSAGLDEADDSNLYFMPEQGNVVFGSAVDGWAFSLDSFAQIYSEKLGFSQSVLKRTLWGDYYINLKAKKIMRGAALKAKKPLFVQLVLDNIWAVYEAVMIRKDKEKLEKIVNSLSLKVLPRDLRSNDSRQQLCAVFSSWLPLADAVLSMVCRKLPSPKELGNERAEKLMCSRTKRFDSLPASTQRLKEAFLNCSADDKAPVIVFISKMVPVPRESLPENKPKPLTEEEMATRRAAARQRHQERQAGEGAVQLTEEQLKELNRRNKADTQDDATENDSFDPEANSTAFIAFARVFSGRLKPGQEVYVLGPKYDPAVLAQKLENGPSLDELVGKDHISKVNVGKLYMLLGRDLEEVEEVPAGNIVGIGGLENHVLKSATLSSDVMCPPFVELVHSAVPILRVAVEPTKSSDLGALTRGLKLLNQADAHVQVIFSESGEQLLVTAGQVHLQRCLEDLTTTFAKCQVSTSQPIVPFRETVVRPPETDMVNEQIEGENRLVKNRNADNCDQPEDKPVVIQTSNKICTIEVDAVPLPIELTQLLEQNEELLKSVDRDKGRLTARTVDEMNELRAKVAQILDKDAQLSGFADKIWSFGPKRYGPNILFNCIDDYNSGSVWQRAVPQSDHRLDLESSLVNGFQLAALAGPLCEEPMMGVGFVVSKWEVADEREENKDWGPLSGQIVSTMKEGCRRAFTGKPQRLVAAMYSCTITVGAEVLGKMFGVLSKRRGRIVTEEMIEGSSSFAVTAHLPVIESMDFASELRKQTSGLAMPQLIFSHWETIDIDPFWEPQTEEELLHFGEKADSEIPVRNYMNDIRKRKGLKIDEKIVEFAEKQRTLTKMK